MSGIRIHRIKLPLDAETALLLGAGDTARLSGTIYCARDAAHRRFAEMLERGEALPFPVRDACIYYAGPAQAPPGKVIGSAGPTTAGRMDLWTPLLLRLGLRGMIGKGERSPEVVAAMKDAGAVYFGATGGAGALLASHIKSAEIAAFPELGTEALRRLEVEDFPVTVIIDARGNSLYETGPAAYLESIGRKND